MPRPRRINPRIAAQGVRLAGTGEVVMPRRAGALGAQHRNERPADASGSTGGRGVPLPDAKVLPGDCGSVLDPIYAAMSEATLQKHVIGTLTRLGFRAYHTWRSDHSAAGFPDVVAIKRPRVVWLELKREAGVVSPSQQRWIDDLLACGQECYVVRPSSWPAVRTALEVEV